MALGFRVDREQDTMNQMLDELREKLRVLAPGSRRVAAVVRRLPGAEAGLKKWEAVALSRGLERVWHIMRLLRLLSEYFGDRILFGGGSIINYVYMVRAGEPPRLTFDLDCAWYKRVAAKRVILAEMVNFNRWLTEQGLTLSVPVSRGRSVQLFIVEYDVDKDYFPHVLSLRMPVITRYDGVPFYRFLGIEDYSLITRLRRVFEEVLGVRDPRIDYVRFEISLDPAGMPRVEARLEDIYGWRTRAWITEVEYQLASKITGKIGKSFGDALRYNLHDILKATLDLRLVKYMDWDKIKRYIRSVNADAVDRNINALLSPTGRALWSRNYHYILVRRRYTLEELVKKVKTLIL